MKIQILGSDAAFDGLNTSFFFKDDIGRGVLVDCGFTVFPELVRRKMVGDVDVVLISHLHADHTGSLTTLAVYNRSRLKKKPIVGGDNVAELFKVQGVLPDDFIPLSADDPLHLCVIKTGHIPAYGYNYGLFIADRILFSGDTNEPLLDTEFAAKAKIILHEATLAEPTFHSNIEILARAKPEIKAKTWLIHIPTEERADIERDAVAKYGFAGVCHNGQVIEV